MLGEEKIAGQFIEEAKRNRKSIVDTAIRRVSSLKVKWAESPSSSETVDAVFDWIHKKARATVTGAASKRLSAHSLQTHTQFQVGQGSKSSDTAESTKNEISESTQSFTGRSLKKCSSLDSKFMAEKPCSQIPKQGEAEQFQTEDMSYDHIENKQEEVASVVLAHDVFRFGRKRDFNLLHVTSCEAVRLQMAISHLNKIKRRGLFGVEINMLLKEARYKAKHSLISLDVIVLAAKNIQRFCRFRICINGTNWPKSK